MKYDMLLTLYSQAETVFTIDFIAQLMPQISAESLHDRLYYFVKVGKLLRLRRGIYAKTKYNQFELANKIYIPSYISLETVLVAAGINFQYYQTIFLSCYLTRTINIGDMIIQYRQLKKDILTNRTGIEEKTGYYIATPERALLDAIYIYKNYHFDNLSSLNWEKINELKNIYKSVALDKRVDVYYKLFKKDYGKY